MFFLQFSSVHFSHSVVSDSLWPHESAACQASLSITNSWSLLRLTSIKSVMPCNHLILCRPLLLLPPIPPSIRVFSNESTLPMRWPKYWSFSFSISPSKEHPGLISFRMDWLDLLAVQGTLKSLLQHHPYQVIIFPAFAFFDERVGKIWAKYNQKIRKSDNRYWYEELYISKDNSVVRNMCFAQWYLICWERINS